MQGQHRASPDPQMGIPPVAEFRIQAQIFPANVEAAHESGSSVYHYDFPMISVVNTQLQTSEKGREELAHLDPQRTDTLPVGAPHLPAAQAPDPLYGPRP